MRTSTAADAASDGVLFWWGLDEIHGEICWSIHGRGYKLDGKIFDKLFLFFLSFALVAAVLGGDRDGGVGAVLVRLVDGGLVGALAFASFIARRRVGRYEGWSVIVGRWNVGRGPVGLVVVGEVWGRVWGGRIGVGVGRY